MKAPSRDTNASSPEIIRQEIDQSLRELRELAGAGHEPAVFYAEVLQRLVRVSAASGAALWIVGARQALHLFQEHRLDKALLGNRRSAIDRERARLADWHQDNKGLITIPDSDLHVAGPTLVCPITPAGTVWGLLTLYLPQDAKPESLRGLSRYLEAVAATATNYQSRNELRHWNQDRDSVSRIHELSMAVHEPWSAEEVYSAVIHEGRRFLNCDRVCLAIRRGSRFRIVAASGSTTLNGRSQELQAMGRLATAVIRLRQAFFYEESSEERPPQIEKPLQSYLEESAARRLAIVPLEPPPLGGERQVNSADCRGRPHAALVVEQMGEGPLDASWQSLWLLVDHAAVAVERATRLRRLPMVGPLLRVPSLRRALTRRWLPRGLISITCLAAAAAALFLVEAEYNVRVTGELTPAVQRHVFAPTEGVVAKLAVHHGQYVEEGQLLVELKSPGLDRERTRLEGEIATTQRRLAAAQAERLETITGRPGGRTQAQIATEAQIAEQELDTLHQELALLDVEARRLHVRSPLSGTVLTWDLQQMLTARPVVQGQRLMTVANLESDWQLSLKAPDHKAGSILEAHDASAEGVRLRFVTAARPEDPHRAIAKRFRMTSETDPSTRSNHLHFEATLVGEAPQDLRPGAEVVAQVACGRRSLGYLWLGELYEELRRRFF